MRLGRLQQPAGPLLPLQRRQARRLFADARGRTDFRGLQASYASREVACVFCALEGSGRVLLENELALCIADAYPVTPGHSLVIPRRHVAAPAGFPVPPGAKTHARTGQATPIQERRYQRSGSWRPCRAITRISAPCSRK